VAEYTPVTWTNMVKRLRQLGFDGPFQGGKHPYMIKSTLVLTIPNPHNKDVSIALLSRILKQAQVSKQEWLNKW
jgi:predicted RNA binding protein YcfA (HicA-like mRNA interferase family)